MDDTNERVIPLHINSFIEGPACPNKGGGQWSSFPPSHLPRDLNLPLCPTRNHSLLTQGENYFEPGEQIHWDGETVIQKRVKFKKLSPFLNGQCITGRYSMRRVWRGQGHEIGISINSVFPISPWERTLVSPPFVWHFKGASSTKSISEEQRTKLVLHSQSNNIVPLPVWECIAGSCWCPHAIKHLPKGQRKLLPSDISPLLL